MYSIFDQLERAHVSVAEVAGSLSLALSSRHISVPTLAAHKVRLDAAKRHLDNALEGLIAASEARARKKERQDV